MRLQDILKQQRHQYHYTQAQLASRLFVSTQAVSKWENGQSVPTVDNLLVLSDLYNLSLDELVQGSPFFKKPYVVGHRYQRSHVVIFLLGWLVLSVLLSGLNFKTWSILMIVFMFVIGYLIPVMTKDYWVIEQSDVVLRQYGQGFTFMKLLSKDPHLKHFKYDEMAKVVIRYRPLDRIQPFDFRADDFKLVIVTKQGQIVDLEMAAHVRDFLPQFINYVERQGVPVEDEEQVVDLLLAGESLYNHFHDVRTDTKRV